MGGTENWKARRAWEAGTSEAVRNRQKNNLYSCPFFFFSLLGKKVTDKQFFNLVAPLWVVGLRRKRTCGRLCRRADKWAEVAEIVLRGEGGHAHA